MRRISQLPSVFSCCFIYLGHRYLYTCLSSPPFSSSSPPSTSFSVLFHSLIIPRSPGIYFPLHLFRSSLFFIVILVCPHIRFLFFHLPLLLISSLSVHLSLLVLLILRILSLSLHYISSSSRSLAFSSLIS